VGDSFSYTIDDVSGATSNVASVTLTVTPVNDAPTAVDDTASVNEGGSVVIDLSGNDTDPDNALDLSSIAITSGPTNGSLVDNGDGTLTYTHDGSETVGDSFSYTIDDVSGATSNVASVTLTVNPVNDAPTAVNDTASVNEGSSVVIDLSGNDTDPDNALDLGSIVITSGPTNGSLVDNGDGTFTYTHDGSETVGDSFSYTIDDVSGATSNVASVTLTVTPQNDAPTASDIAFSLAENSANGTVVGTVSASDPDAADTLSYAITAGDLGGAFAIDAATGEITVNDSTQLDFETTPVFNLTVTVTDAGGLTGTGIVPISVQPGEEPAVIDTSDIPPTDEGEEPTDDSDDTDTTEEAADSEEDPAGESTTEANAPAEQGELPLEISGQVAWSPASFGLPEADVLTSHANSSSEEFLHEPHEVQRNPYDRAEHAAAAEGRFAMVRSQQMMQALDQIRQEMAEDAELAAGERETIVSTAEEVALAFSAGLLGILLRGSSLAAMALSALPVWRRVDPLAILALSDEERRKREEELRSARETEDQSEEAVGRLLD
jgi:cytochrome oxidase Cu insertion factor (SCO1/SenC/PrrC family)